MTTAELREKVGNSPNKEWFEEISITINNPALGINETVKGLVAIYEFAQQQIKGWESFGENIPVDVETSKFKAEKLKNTIIALTDKFLPTFLEKEKRNQWKDVENIYKENSKQILLFNTPEAQFLFEINQKFPVCFRGAFDYLTEGVKHDLVYQKNYFLGLQLAAGYTARSKGLVMSPEQLREDAESKTNTNHQSYVSEAEAQLSGLLTKINSEKKSVTDGILKAKQERENEVDHWFKETKNNFLQFDKDARAKSNDLIKTFQEYTRLKEPAEYWEKRAAKLNKQGKTMLTLLISIIFIGGLCLYFLLWKTPEGLLKSFFNDDKAVSLRWSIVFIVFISLIFLGIRFVSRIMFSSYHLARDAEERHQLTHVYLSLIKESAISDKEKLLIMQSLFSRADTGLLKEDSTPTMPGGMDKIFKS